MSSLRTAKQAVDDYLDEVTEDQRLKAKGLENLRQALLERAAKFYEQFASHQASDPQLRLEGADALYRLASIQRQLDQSATARQTCRRALSLLDMPADALQSPQAEYLRGHLLLHEGNCFFVEGNLTQAEQSYVICMHHYEQMIALRAFANGSVEAQVAACRGNLANVHLQRGSLNKALEQVKSAIAIYRRLVAEYPKERQHAQLLAHSLVSLGDLLHRTGEQSQAVNVLQEALQINGQQADSQPQDAKALVQLARNYQTLVQPLAALKDQAKAERMCEEAVKNWKLLADQHPDVPEYARQLAAARNELTNLYRQRNRKGESESGPELAMTQIENHHGQLPGPMDYRHQEAVERMNLGASWVSVQRYDDAEREFRRAIELFQSLRKLSPDNPHYADGEGTTWCKLGLLLSRLRRSGEALGCYDASIAAEKIAVAKAPDVPHAREQLCLAHAGRASTLDALGEHAQAAADWEKARALATDRKANKYVRKLVFSLVRSGQVRSALSLADTHLRDVCLNAPAGKQDAGLIYDCARVYALGAANLGKHPEPTAAEQAEIKRLQNTAISLLEQAVSLGMTESFWFTSEPDLAAVKALPEFQRLLREITQNK